MRITDLVPVAGSPFEPLVDNVHWVDEELPENLRVSEDPDWLVTVNEDGDPDRLVGFSVESVYTADVKPPRDLREVKVRLGGEATFGWLNTDMTAKGLGSVMANTDRALQPSSVRDPVISVRSVAIGDVGDIHRRDEAETVLGRRLRLVRHGSLLAVATTVDIMTKSDIGTERAMRFMEHGYGDARIVEMPAPPIWQEQQRSLGVAHDIQPRTVLVRGGRFAQTNVMKAAGFILR